MMDSTVRLSAMQAKNFKAFLDTGSVALRPVTLLFGHNSSGKTALLSILPMLQQTLEDPNRSTPLVLSSESGVDLGSFKDVVHRHEVSLRNPFWITLALEIPAFTGDRSADPATRRIHSAFRALGITAKYLQIHLGVSYNKRQRAIALTEFRVSRSDEEPLFRLYKKTTAISQPWYVSPSVLADPEVVLTWHHFLPRFTTVSRSSDAHPFSDLTLGINNAVSRDLAGIVHIGPLRGLPSRAYRLTGESPRDVGGYGENWLALLIRARARVRLTDQVNSWLRRLGYTLRIEWGKQGYVHPLLKDEAGVETSLKDVGFGISQLLPVLIQGFSSSPGTILILEQPEIHLHPRAQAELGDILVAIASRGIRLLVETHSEHLLLRIQRRIAEAALSPDSSSRLSSDDVYVYLVQREGDHSTATHVPLTETGLFSSPPEAFQTFFSDDFEEAVMLTQAVASASKGK